MNLTLPGLLSSGSSSSGSLPKPLNQQTYYKTPYPSVDFLGYTGSPSSPSATTLGSFANISKTFADHTVVETVGSTSINAYFRSIVDAFQLTGNFYASLADVGGQTEMTDGWSMIASVIPSGTYTISDTVRIASTEKLKAGVSVGANIQYCPAFKFNFTGVTYTGGDTGQFTNIVVAATFKLMSSSGTLTTIGTLSSTAISTTTVTDNVTRYAFSPVLSGSFTPVTSSDGDRIIVELTITGNYVAVGVSSGSRTITPAVSLGFGFTGSIRTLGTDYQAYRPFQISMS